MLKYKLKFKKKFGELLIYGIRAGPLSERPLWLETFAIRIGSTPIFLWSTGGQPCVDRILKKILETHVSRVAVVGLSRASSFSPGSPVIFLPPQNQP